jgi:hypothetical protein
MELLIMQFSARNVFILHISFTERVLIDSYNYINHYLLLRRLRNMFEELYDARA